MKNSIIFLSIILSISNLCQAQDDVLPQFKWYKPKDTIIYKKAVRMFESGKYMESTKVLFKLSKKAYAEAGTLNLVGLCLHELGNYEAAITAFNLALTNSPQAIGVYYNRALSLMQWGKYKGAASDFAAYAIHFPENKTANLNIAYCLSQDGQVNSAIKYLEKYEHKDTTIYNALSWYYIDNKDDFAKAIEILEPLLKAYPTYSEGVETLSIAYSEMGNAEDALHQIEKLIALKPDYGRAYYLKGVYQEELNLEEDAETSFFIARKKGYVWKEEYE